MPTKIRQKINILKVTFASLYARWGNNKQENKKQAEKQEKKNILLKNSEVVEKFSRKLFHFVLLSLEWEKMIFKNIEIWIFAEAKVLPQPKNFFAFWTFPYFHPHKTSNFSTKQKTFHPAVKINTNFGFRLLFIYFHLEKG